VARDSLVSLLGAGRSALAVWESLEMAGFVTRWLPEWERVQFRATRTPVHRHTVERHLIETAIVASGLTRNVARPDLLLLAALLHDLGKGLPGDHSETGSVIAGDIARRIGLSPGDAATLALLVRHHLLLPEMATRRDPDDPATIDAVVRAVGSADVLDLLAALTEADATAAGPIAWSPQRAALITDLARRVNDVLGGAPPPKPERITEWQRELAASGELAVRRAEPSSDGLVDLTIVAPDRAGLLADVAGALALRRLDVRRAATETLGEQAVLTLTVSMQFGEAPDEATLRDDISRALSGRLDIAERLAERAAHRRAHTIAHAEPSVAVLTEASDCATVVEVRAHDEPTLLYRLVRTIAEHGGSIRAAAIETLGAEAVDVFYLVDGDGALPEAATARTVAALRSAIV
jgi:[protein-PII] uridylyltransferase